MKPDVAYQRLMLARRALIATGYFLPSEVSDDIAPRIAELWSRFGKEMPLSDASLKAIAAIDSILAGGGSYAEHAAMMGLPSPEERERRRKEAIRVAANLNAARAVCDLPPIPGGDTMPNPCAESAGVFNIPNVSEEQRVAIKDAWDRCAIGPGQPVCVPHIVES